jgi:hypothetical protein
LSFAPNRPGETEEVGQEVVSHFGEDGLGMKLNPLHYILPVSHPHYYSLGSFGGDFETGGEPVSFDD